MSGAYKYRPQYTQNTIGPSVGENKDMGDDCKHLVLNLIEGALHPSGKDYVCKECGEQFRAEKIEIGVSFGTPGGVQGERT